jgi:flagella synthesis protein FlgN
MSMQIKGKGQRMKISSGNTGATVRSGAVAPAEAIAENGAAGAMAARRPGRNCNRPCCSRPCRPARHARDRPERVAMLRDALAKGELPFDPSKLAGLIQRFHGGERDRAAQGHHAPGSRAPRAAGHRRRSQGYAALLALLEEQFQATLRHRTRSWRRWPTRSSPPSSPRCAPAPARRLVTALLGPEGDMPQLFALLPEDARATAQRDWSALEQMVLECKRLNARNSELLVEQYSIMQRVLHGEEDTYAPG